MNTTNTQFFIQAKPLFRYKRTTGQVSQGKKNDPTITTITLTGMMMAKPVSTTGSAKSAHTCYNIA